MVFPAAFVLSEVLLSGCTGHVWPPDSSYKALFASFYSYEKCSINKVRLIGRSNDRCCDLVTASEPFQTSNSHSNGGELPKGSNLLCFLYFGDRMRTYLKLDKNRTNWIVEISFGVAK